jgi:hypothetical protein
MSDKIPCGRVMGHGESCDGGDDGKHVCDSCLEINRLKAIILDRNEAIEVFQDIVETNKDKIEAMSYALTSVGQTLVTISAHVVNCVNKIEDARKK